MKQGPLQPLLAPNSIAIVGASDDPTRIGGRPLHFLKEAGFAGEIYPVNARRERVQGLPAYRDLAAIGKPVDLVIVATPAAAVLDVMRSAAAVEARAAVLFSSGFAELGEAGQAMQEEVLALAQTAGIRVLGPNALGLYCAESRAAASFSSLFEQGLPRRGNVAVVSQSGAVAVHLAYLALERGLGFSHWITTGNEADLAVHDFIGALADAAEVSVIAVYLEGARDGRALVSAIARARRNGKRVVVMKVGRSALGEKAAQSHTASLAGDDVVFEVAIRDAGASRCDRIDGFLNAIYTLAKASPIAGDRLGLLTVSGGVGVLMADAAADTGFELPPLPPDRQARLRQICPFGSPINPVDVTAQAMNDMSLVTAHMREMFDAGQFAAGQFDAGQFAAGQFDAGQFDAGVAFFMNWLKSGHLAPALEAALADAVDDEPAVPIAIVGNVAEETRKALEAKGFLVFEDPSSAIEALAILREQSQAPAEPRPSGKTVAAGDVLAERYNEAEAAGLLAAHGIPFPKLTACSTSGEAADAVRAIGGPAVLKILSPDIMHKSDLGGVRIGIPPSAAETEAAAMLAEVAASCPTARIEGVLVAPVVEGVADIIVGARRDPAFGPVIMVGLGGVFAEIFADTATRLAPVMIAEATGMLQSLKGWPLLNGVRGRPAADIEALAEVIVNLSRFAAAHAEGVEAVELNPVSVGARGHGAFALDAVIHLS